ncbi:MAG: transposase [Tannerellaceae bacterium]|nr:transposase [Tannerellaceae bacterium]
MSPAFISGVMDNLPAVCLVFDKFHRIPYASVSVHKIKQ